MTATHMLILATFIFLGGVGLAAIQDSLSQCIRSIALKRKPFDTKSPQVGICRKSLAVR